jgi:hypothetical protein
LACCNQKGKTQAFASAPGTRVYQTSGLNPSAGTSGSAAFSQTLTPTPAPQPQEKTGGVAMTQKRTVV